MSTLYLPEQSEWKQYCKRVKLDTGIEMSYIELGNPEKEPLVLIHGFSDSSMAYHKIVSYTQDDFHIYCFDMRGHGNSEKPKQFAYTIMEVAEDVINLADKLELDKFYLAGHSMGSMVTQAVCFSAPEKIKKAALLSSFARFQDTPKQVDEFRKTFETWAKDGVDIDDFLPTNKTYVDKGYIPQAKALLNDWPEYCFKAGWWGMELSDNRRFLQYIKCPLVMVWGTEDDVVPPPLQDELKSYLPNVPVKMLEGKTHEILQEAPDQVAEILKDFFK